MKKKIFGGALVLAIVVVVAFNLNLIIGNNETSALILANIEALASESNAAKYTRITDDCKITITGKAGASVTVAGIGTIKLDSNGEYTYTKSKGEVRCIGGGNEVCIPQNC